MSKAIQYGKNMEVVIETEKADSILYFLIDSKGKIQASEKLNVEGDTVSIEIVPDMTKNLQIGANSIKIFAISNSVLKPDFYESSFLVTEKIQSYIIMSSKQKAKKIKQITIFG